MREHLQAGWVWVEVECRRAGWHRINFFMVKFEDGRVKEVEITDVENLLNAPLDEIQKIKGGLTVESNLSELVEEADLDTKIQIMGNEVEIPVGRLPYDKLKGKKIKVVVKE